MKINYDELSDYWKQYVAEMMYEEDGSHLPDYVDECWRDEVEYSRDFYKDGMLSLESRCNECEFYDDDGMKEFYEDGISGPSTIGVETNLYVKEGMFAGVYFEYAIECEVDSPKECKVLVLNVHIEKDEDIRRIYNECVPQSMKSGVDENDMDALYDIACEFVNDTLEKRSTNKSIQEHASKCEIPQFNATHELLTDYANLITFCIDIIQNFDTMACAIRYLEEENPEVSEYLE